MELVVCWCYELDEYVLLEGYIAHSMAELLLQKGPDALTKDRRISHWMPRVVPK